MKTPQQSYPLLADAIGVSDVYLKREDLHQFGSHKGRSIPVMIKQSMKEGMRQFVISSSGNAALAAILAIQAHNRNNTDHPLSLTVFVGKNIDEKKLALLNNVIEDTQVTISQVDRPKQMAFQQEKTGTAKFLRQSTDDTALIGYQELADELNNIPDLSAVFVPTSSGTTAQALGTEFENQKDTIQIHIVQTTACHPIAQLFDIDGTNTETSLAGAIVDHIAHRKENVVRAVQTSKGSGWIITDAEIQEAIALVEKTANILLSPNSALSVAGLIKAKKKGWSWTGPVACLITGR